MEKIIKLKGTIVGIAYEDPSRVNIKLECKEYACKERKSLQYGEPENISKDKYITIPYLGPVRLDSSKYNDFVFSDSVQRTHQGIGALISDLFVEDEVEVYAHCHSVVSTNDNEHLILDEVIISTTTPRPLAFAEFLQTV